MKRAFPLGDDKMKLLKLALFTTLLLSPSLALAEDKKTEVKSESDPKEEVDESKTYADQDDFNPNTIFGDATKDMDHGGYGAVTMSYGKLLDYDVTFAGGRGGWVLDHKYIIGGGGYGLGTEIDVEDGDDTKKLDVDYGGLMLGYTFNPTGLFHVQSTVLMGTGEVETYTPVYGTDEEKISELEEASHTESRFAVIEPQVQVEMNVVKWMRIGVGASYRMVSALKSDYLTNEDLSGVSGTLSFNFGCF
jgi:hypothetical protein